MATMPPRPVENEDPWFAKRDAWDAAVEAEVEALDTRFAGTIPKSLVDAKGDLIAATANDTPARVAVGANGTVLTADSAAAAGVKWAAAAGALSKTSYVMPIPIYAPVGGYQVGYRAGGRGSDRTPQATVARAFPFLPLETFTADQFHVQVSGGVAGSQLHLGIYTAAATGIGPDALARDAGTVATDSGGSVGLIFSTPFTFVGGTLYYIALKGGVTDSAALWAFGSNDYQRFAPDAWNATTGGGSPNFWREGVVAGSAWPAAWGAINHGDDWGNFPCFAFRRSA